MCEWLCQTHTYADAAARCAAAGGRLCTQAEVQAGDVQGTGCSYDYMYVWTSEKCGSSDAPSFLVNGTQLVSRITSLAKTIPEDHTQTGTSGMSTQVNGVDHELLSMDPVFVDIAMGREKQYEVINSAIAAHLATSGRSGRGPVDMNAKRQTIPGTAYYAAAVKGWWSVKLENAPAFHRYKDVRVILELATQGEEDLATYNDIKVWIARDLPSDRPELIQGIGPILRQEFDDPLAWNAAASEMWSKSTFGPLGPPPSGFDAFTWLGTDVKSQVHIPGIDGLNVPKIFLDGSASNRRKNLLPMWPGKNYECASESNCKISLHHLHYKISLHHLHYRCRQVHMFPIKKHDQDGNWLPLRL